MVYEIARSRIGHNLQRLGHKNTYECIKAFSETGCTEDLKKLDVPTLIVHGDDDQGGAERRIGARLGTACPRFDFEGLRRGPHGLTDTHKDQLDADLLDFVHQ